MNTLKVKEQLKYFLLEDIGDKDLTTDSLFPDNHEKEVVVIAKEQGILAGIRMIALTYEIIDPTIKVIALKHDGEEVKKGDLLAIVKGSAKSILMGERVCLNLLQRMSGIATLTNVAKQKLNSTHTQIADTRKTTPGLRLFEKYAVTCGGGVNHRNGLYDGVMLKDNHIAFYGSITEAVAIARKSIGPMVKIEVETENKAQVEEAVACDVDIIMFDNQDPETITQSITLVPQHIVTEASGNIDLTNIVSYRQTGVDYISLGFITHSAKALDISMKG
ncbi:putative nicotinate-nucleotide pyrophosphorylase [carboxylating] [Paraliobacillus ryukyuensis]|uniref:Probable nicotinate-nucleotide pyrophosphorylase [carboxylating] n=1 Tax=Paraliobacillus ryukyuensis TaxID=200904 RepID=A0A366DPQ8_9BACI|nr:carboxylating nicotinate-nucleotide diphosphorylase [Paraliobacillus ryukyuensis]RBO92077.1 nicotinate-nucleotide pyrophosphorylase [carboxylating] [Paraliobacillus ryukyuensis]